MAVSTEEREFVDHVVDLMQVVGPVSSRGMFGGHGLFIDGVMVGLIAWGELYLKVDDGNEPLFAAQGLERFCYRKDDKEMYMSYCQAPEQVFEDPDQMREWGTSAWDAALRAQSAKTKSSGGKVAKKSAKKTGSEKICCQENCQQEEARVMMSAEFFVTSLIVVLLPGTGVIYTISTGLLRGGRASLFAAFGCTLGIVPHMAASILGLAAILHASALAFQIVKFAGVAYLLYMAWSMWKETGGLSLADGAPALKPIATMARGFLINILNPKLSLFFLAFLPQFIDPHGGLVIVQMFELSGVFMTMTLLVFIGYGLLADLVRQHVVGSLRVQRFLQRSFAVTFAALGLRLAVAEPR